MRYRSAVATQPNTDMNQDRWFVDVDRGIFGVLDGMRGGGNGEVAAEFARGHILARMQLCMHRSLFSRLWSPSPSVETVRDALVDVLKDVSGDLYRVGGEKFDGMGTTATVCCFVQQQGIVHIVVGNVGDSRAYLLRQEMPIEQLTLDDSSVRILFPYDDAAAFKMQKKLASALRREDLTHEEWRIFHDRHLMTQVVGDGAHIHTRLSDVSVDSGDRILLCTDGIHDNLTDQEIGEIVRSAETLEDGVSVLLRIAEERSWDGSLRSHHDDMTALLIAFDE